jgi:hypothetical protein
MEEEDTMRSTKRQAMLVTAGLVIATGAMPGIALADTDLHVCTWLTKSVGGAVGSVSAAPGAVLGPNNGGLPGGDKGPYPIYFTTSDGLLLAVTSGNSSCA